MIKTLDLSSYCIDRAVLLKMAALFAKEEGTCLLYSGGDFDSSSRSLLFLFPYESIEIRAQEDPWGVVKNKISLDAFWVGFFSYEMGTSIDSSRTIPNAYFQKSAFVLVVDHKTNQSTLHLESEGLNSLSIDAKRWMENFSNELFWKSWINHLPDIPTEESEDLKIVKNFESLESYVDKVTQIQEMIRDGEVYQVNLSHELTLSGKRNPFFIFSKLVEMNPAPFSAYMNYKNFTVVSSSPERFLNKRHDTLETRPIKGTIKRGQTKEEDFRAKETLLHSEKDLAELLMITDLMRNDLGKISLPGSVKTLKISHIEAYTNVYHLLSIIQSTPILKKHPVDLLKACFPGGSITGCPKLASMKVIKHFEKRERGIYTGSMGYFSPGANFDFNIAIRTLIFQENEIHLSLGGAITIDSTAAAEYEETMQKGHSIFQSLGLM